MTALTPKQLRYIAENQFHFESTINKILSRLADSIDEPPSAIESKILEEIK